MWALRNLLCFFIYKLPFYWQVSQGGTIPDIYHMSNEERYFKDRSQVKKLVIPKSAKEEVIIDVADNGSTIQWEFLISKSKDIGFGLYQEVSNEDVAEILPMEIYRTPDGKECGSYKCHRAGRCKYQNCLRLHCFMRMTNHNYFFFLTHFRSHFNT